MKIRISVSNAPRDLLNYRQRKNPVSFIFQKHNVLAFNAHVGQLIVMDSLKEFVKKVQL
jgi:hypothetical protein